MDSMEGNVPRTRHHRGGLIVEGKTKKIFSIRDNDRLAEMSHKDDITAGDGAKHDVIPDKGILANQTNANVFRLLNACGVPTAFVEQVSAASCIVRKCQMFPYEIVTRREAHGSYLKRNPHIAKGHLFPRLIDELFLKTKDKKWKNYDLPCDDPYMVWTPREIQLYRPDQPIAGQAPFLILKEMEVFSYPEEFHLFDQMRSTTRKVFLILEKAWHLEERRLVDMKVEFGSDSKGDLLLADVIDNDSWRVIEKGSYIDKQAYREGGALDEVAEKYRRVAEITNHFQVPHQRIILWSGSEKDEAGKVFTPYLSGVGGVSVENVVCSVHKESVRAAAALQQLVHEVPDSVVIAYIGRSNGAGPTLSAMSTIPVITVPAGYRDFPDDVWSSLRTPSNVPVMTVLEPSNAALAALQILSARNPRLYAYLREEVEKRTINTVQI